MWSRLFILFILIGVLAGCSNRFVIRKNKIDTDYQGLVEYIRNNDKGFNTYSIKYTGKFSSDAQNLRFRGLLRIVKGEKIWVSISPMGIEAARILFTPEKIKFINRKNNTYFVSNYNYFQNQYNVDLNFDLLENILTNRFLLLPHEEGDDVNKTDHGLYNVNYNGKDSTMQSFMINPALKKLTQVVFKDLKKNATLSVEFKEFVDVENHTMPEQIHFNIEQDRKKVDVDLNYKKITVNKSFKTPFRIPSKYKQVWP